MAVPKTKSQQLKVEQAQAALAQVIEQAQNVISIAKESAKEIIENETKSQLMQADFEDKKAQLESSHAETAAQYGKKEAELRENYKKMETELETQYKEKARAEEVNFGLALKENRKKVVSDVLGENGLVSIESAELRKLRDDYAGLKSSFDQEVKTATAKAYSEADKKVKDMEIVMELKQKAASAELQSELTSTKQRNADLQAQLEQYRAEIVANRNAETERVKAMSGKDVVINTGVSK